MTELAHIDTTTGDSWTPINLNTLPDRPPVQPTLGNLGLVYPGKRHVFSGPQESAKTLAAYAIGIEIVRHGGTVLIVDFEMGSWDARQRLRELGATPDDLANMPYLEPSEPANTGHFQTLLTLPLDLVIIDAAAGAYDLQGLDDNKRQDVEKLSGLYVRTFWKAGVATIMLDHVVKNTETRGKYAIGSERKVGGADVHLGFEVITPIARGTHGLYKIVTHKDRGGYLKRGKLADLHLTSDPDTHQLTWTFTPAEHDQDDRPQLPTVLMERASRYLEEQTEPVTRNQIVLNTKGTAEYVRAAIDHLCALGFVTETSGPNRARVYSTTRPFIRSEWETEHHSKFVGSSSAVRRDEPVAVRRSSSSPIGGDAQTTDPSDQPSRRRTTDEDDDPEETARLMSLYITEPAPEPEPEKGHHDDDLPL